MLRKDLFDKTYYRACCLVLFAITAAASFNGNFDEAHFAEAGVPGHGVKATFEMIVDGTAYRPYIYRQLMPTLVNWIDAATPQSVKSRLYERHGVYPDAHINAIAISPTAENPTYFFRYLMMYLLVYLFAVAAVYAMHMVCNELQMPAPVALLAPIVVILLVPYVNSSQGRYYDYPELTFLALAVWAAIKFDWFLVVPIAILAVWNKESFAAFIPALYPLFRVRSSRIKSALSVVAVGFCCLPTYLYIHHRFAHNPGSTVVFKLHDLLDLLLHPGPLVRSIQETYGLPMLSGMTLLPTALLVWTIWRSWKYLPKAMKHHALIVACIIFPLFILFTNPGEIRDLSMFYISFLAMLAVNLKVWFDTRQTQAAAATP
jgi:hypothetical protein